MPAEDAKRDVGHDAVMSALGVEVVEVAPGWAVAVMTARPEHADRRGTVDRGIAFTVADVAIALASNSYGPPALLVHADVQWLGHAAVGDRLTATCRAVHRGPTSATFESRLTTSDQRLVGVVWGTTRSPRATTP